MSFMPCIPLGMSYIDVIHVLSVTSSELDTCYSCRAYHLECVTYMLFMPRIPLGMSYRHFIHVVSVTSSE